MKKKGKKPAREFAVEGFVGAGLRRGGGRAEKAWLFSLSSRSPAGRGGLDFGRVAVAGVDVVGKKFVCMTTLPCAGIERGSNRGLRD
jgi:hypothetical protein